MKRIFSIVFIGLLLLMIVSVNAQLSHQSHQPPVNPGYPFVRGLYIDCADEIINDIANDNVLNLRQELYDYIRKNYVGYIILCGLEQAGIFGNLRLENALRKFLLHTRYSFPGIQIGISGSDSGEINSTATVAIPFSFRAACFPKGTISNITYLDSILNNSGTNSASLKRSELCKFFLRAAVFGSSWNLKNTIKINLGFDAFYLEYRYWNYTSSLAEMQDAFLNFKTILSVMQVLKCNTKHMMNIDAEFLPTEFFNQQAWTAIDQITEADPLMNRMMIPAFTKNAAGVFDQVCKTLHFLSDRFSKPQTTLFIKMSAESSSFNYCNSLNEPKDYLGDYLNGTTTPSGNLFSVEQSFLNKFNDPLYMCSSCSCRPFEDNHYSLSNIFSNQLAGSMWTPYSMLNGHSLYRIPEIKNETSDKKNPLTVELIDINGRIISTYKSFNDIIDERNNQLPVGIYFLKTLYSDGSQEVIKYLRIEGKD